MQGALSAPQASPTDVSLFDGLVRIRPDEEIGIPVDDPHRDRSKEGGRTLRAVWELL